MAEIIVVGSGFAGLSAAARLAKLRHRVTVLEQADHPGGLLLGRKIGGQTWAAGPQSVTLPGVFRDLFRKSGRPMDALITISAAPSRRHVFPRRFAKSEIVLDLPFGTRSAQHDAVVDAFGADAWSSWVDSLAGPWDTLRRAVLESVEQTLTPATTAAMFDSQTIEILAKSLPKRLRPMAGDLGPAEVTGLAVDAVIHYVERNFGRWVFDGEMIGLANALVTRLAERRVPIETDTKVVGVSPEPGDRWQVHTQDGPSRSADFVVWAVGKERRLSALAAVAAPELDLAPDWVAHVRPSVQAWQSGPGRWVFCTIQGADPIALAQQAGVDFTSAQVFRPTESERTTGQEPVFLTREQHWGRACIESEPGFWRVGAAAHPLAGLEWTGMGTAALALHLGAAPR